MVCCRGDPCGIRTRMDMRMDMYMDMDMNMRMGMCVDMHMDIRMDMRMDMCMGMCVGIRMGMRVDMSTEVFVDAMHSNACGMCKKETSICVCIGKEYTESGQRHAAVMVAVGTLGWQALVGHVV